MTLGYKSWLEIRWRLAMSMCGWCFLAVTFLLSVKHAGGDPVRAIAAAARVETVLAVVFGAMLAGTGVQTQSTGFGPTRTTESVLFTLSLPVSRRRMLAARAGAGAMAMGLVVVLFWLLLPAMAALRPGWPGWKALWGALLFQAVAALAAYCCGMLCQARFSETAFAFGLAFVGAAAGLGAGLEWTPGTSVLDFVSGATFIRTGQIAWTGIAVCLVLSAVFAAGAMRVIERREF